MLHSSVHVKPIPMVTVVGRQGQESSIRESQQSATSFSTLAFSIKDWHGYVQVHSLVEKNNVVRDDWNGYNVLHDSASRVAALDLGFLKSASAAKGDVKTKFVYLLGSDDFPEEEVPQDAFVVYQVPPSVQLEPNP